MPELTKENGMDLTDNIGYGAFPASQSCSTQQERIYEQIGSRRNGIYGGNHQDLEMDSCSAYDVVL